MLLLFEVHRTRWLHYLLLLIDQRFASLVKSVDVKVGEVRGRLVQVVVQRAAQACFQTITSHVLELLIQLLVCDDLLHRDSNRIGNVE